MSVAPSLNVTFIPAPDRQDGLAVVTLIRFNNEHSKIPNAQVAASNIVCRVPRAKQRGVRVEECGRLVQRFTLTREGADRNMPGACALHRHPARRQKKDARLASCVLVQPNRRTSAGGAVAAVKPAQLHRAEQCAEHDQRPRYWLGDGLDTKIIHSYRPSGGVILKNKL